jgi:hypothetical protein
MSTMEFDGQVYGEGQQYEDDKRLLVQFFMTAVQDKAASEAEGRPIFKEVPNVRIITPGSRDVMVTRATEGYQRRFARHWERFKQQADQNIDGTRLEEVPWLTVGTIQELKAVNVHSLEALASMPDSAINKMMGMVGFRQKARNFIENAKAQVPFVKMQAQLDERDNQIATMQEQINQLMAANAAAKAAKG